MPESMPNELVCKTRVRLTRSGRAIRLVHDNGCTITSDPDPTLLGLLVKGRRWWAELARGELDVARLARRENVNPSYLTRVARLALVSPGVIEAILAGKTRADLDGNRFLALVGRTSDWAEQQRSLIA
ncbi:hypothetical protein EKN06_11895 [Croceicoccus ponticola]|uniref:Uncharacterized protein n=1 Tax=Croceicoccus ponticola TaxID=2217664 RepID=A0A437GVW3_9SPHN|nr:hypothetical protein [Croceicoccus ponticola]RVQ66037.1 hypothetical protein EKN06_11895 [Croceicoccus ponticola]